MTTSTDITTYKTPEQQTANFLYQQAKVLSQTEIVPSHLRGKPDHIYAIILTGHEIGVSPTNALQSFASINGKLTMSAELMRGLILGAGHSLSFPESSTTTCTIVGKRKGTGDTASVTYSQEDAERAGLWNTHTWKKYPRQLLSARATTELARLLFPDIIKGVSYTPEEIGGEYIDDDNKISFQVESAAIDDQPIDEVAELVEQTLDDIAYIQNQDEPVEPPMPDEEIAFEHALAKDDDTELLLSNSQRGKIFAVTGKLVKTGIVKQEILDEAYKVMFGDKSRSKLTVNEASTWIEYLVNLETGSTK